MQVKEGAAGSWTGWLAQTTQTQGQFIGTRGYSYTFRIRATDNVSNTAQTWQESQLVTINAVTKYYTHGGQRVAMRQNDVVYYLSSDHLGSTSLTTDAAGQPIAQTRYLPYGEERWTNGTTPTDFGFTAQRHEAGFGLMDYNARYYSTRLGRFVSPDTMVPNPLDSQAFNRYAYVNNNPVNHTDPSGHGCLVCMYQEVTVGGGGSGGTGANPISVGETGGGGEVVLVAVALIAVPLMVEAGKTVHDIITPFPGTAPDLGTQPGISGDEYSSGEVIPGPPSDGEFTGPWDLSGPAELQQPNNPSGFPANSGIELPNVLAAEDHHIISPRISIRYNFRNHPAIKETGINLKKDADNIVSLENHRGRHTYKYHARIQARLDELYEEYGGTEQLETKLRDLLGTMRQELLDDTLDPYEK